jgi:hypothetical protein
MREPRICLDRGTEVSSDAFQPAEIAELADLRTRWPAHRWTRRRGPAGEDVIEIRLGSECPALIELRKADGVYAVTDFGGWGLAIFEDLTAMIGALAGRFRRRPPASLALPEAG